MCLKDGLHCYPQASRDMQRRLRLLSMLIVPDGHGGVHIDSLNPQGRNFIIQPQLVISSLKFVLFVCLLSVSSYP